MFARTERLFLRPGWPEDATILARAIGDQAIVRNLATAPWPYCLAHAQDFLATKRPASEASFLVFRRTHGSLQLVGSAGLGRQPDGEIELGYWIARPFWGLGYATEAAGAVVAFARHTLRRERLAAGHFLDNPASGRVLRKLGFQPTGVVASRHSAGRGEAAPCRLFELRLGKGEVQAEDQDDVAPTREMIAA